MITKMECWRVVGIAVLSLLFCAFVESKESRYLVVSPSVYRAGSNEVISATMFDLIKRTILLVTVECKMNVKWSKTAIFQPEDSGKPKDITLKVPENAKAGTCKLVIVGSGGLNFKKQKDVRIEKTGFDMFIQTDKPAYKPGDKVRFRVIVVNPNLKPASGQINEIAIVNPSGTRILQWKNKDLDEGFISLDFTLSKKPVLGGWKITAKYKDVSKEANIKVDKYVLPKFEVTVEEPSFLYYKSKTFSSRICAKYTYGKKVEGKVTATFCYKYKKFYRWLRRLPACVAISKKIDGCADFDVAVPKGYQAQTWNQLLSVHASVTESATGVTLNGTKNVTLTRNELKLEFISAYNFKPGFPFSGKVLIKRHDGKPAINKEIRLRATCCNSRTIITIRKIAVNGILEFSFVPPSNAKRLSLHASHYGKGKIYQGQSVNAYRSIKSWYSPSNTYLMIKKPTYDMQVGRIALISVKFNPRSMSDSKLYYKLLCRGNIEDSGAVKCDDLRKKIASQMIPIYVTQKMVPKCRMLVYFVRTDGEFVGDSVELPVEKKFENEVTVSFSESQTKPGENISISLQAAPGSRFALSAVDKSVHLLGASNDLKASNVMNVIEKLDVTNAWNQRKSCYSPRHWYSRRRLSRGWPGGIDEHVDGAKAFNDAGLLYFSNLKIDVKPCRRFPVYYRFGGREEGFGPDMGQPGIPGPPARPRMKTKMNIKPPQRKRPSSNDKKKSGTEKVVVRSNFPETWIWTEGRISTRKGRITIEAKVPDTLTTWYANAFALSSRNGVGVASPATLLVFQPFFVSLSLPYSMVRGESVSVPVTVFNYLENCLTVRLSIVASKDFDSDIYSSKLCVCGGRSNTMKFKITPKRIGKIPITVKAISTNDNVCAGDKMMANSVGAADAVKRMLRVEPEGVKKEYNYNSLFCLRKGDSEYSESFRLKLPSQVVPDSIFAKISLYGDLMGPSLNDLDKLLAMPYGCGEQNMLKFAPNIYILQYLTKTFQLTSEIEERAKKFMVAGYQRELTYKRKDGSYSAFGNRDKEGSTWLTAFVLKSYAQARPYIFIDGKEITDTMAWLLRLQKSDGCFKEIGMVHHKAMKGGVSSGISMTSFVLSALIEAGLDLQSAEAQLALKCINNGLSTLKDTYSTAMIAYTMTVAQSPNRAALIDKLNKLAIHQDGTTHWESGKKSPYGPAPADVEMTAYALLAFMSARKKEILSSTPIVRWLAKQRNSLGGFASTQDTCVALQALAVYGGEMYETGTSMNINVVASKLNHNFVINDDNKLVLQQVEVPVVPTNVRISAKGKGCALLQANVKYNLPVTNDKPKFFLQLTMTQVGKKCRHSVKICASYSGRGASNMALIDIKMVSGFEPVTEHLDELLQSTSNDLLKDYEFENNKLSLYFEKIEAKTCLAVLVEQTSIVTNRKKAHAMIYDYYNTGERASTSYAIDKCNEWN